MGLNRWRKVALATVMASAPVAVASASPPARAASTVVVTLSASLPHALSDSDNVYFDAAGTHDSSCPGGSYLYQFNFGDTSPTTTSTYAFAYHYFHVRAGQTNVPFTVTLDVSDSCSNTGVAQLTEHVDSDTPPMPALNVTPTSSTDCPSSAFEVYADASATQDNAESSPYEFDFFWGDGQENTTFAPIESACHLYAVPMTYSVKVNVIDNAGLQASITKTIHVPTVTSPGAPTDVQAHPASAAAMVSWSAPGSGGTPSSYTVTASPGGNSTTVPGNVLQAQVSGLTNGQSYSFTVTATRGSGSATSQASNPVVPLGQPGPPTGVTATASDSAAVVSWTAPSNNGSSKPQSYHQGELGYTVTPTSAQGSLQPIQVPGNPAPTELTIPNLTNGVAYTFSVTAANAVSTSAPASTNAPVAPQQIGPTIAKGPGFKLIEPSTVGSSATNLPLTMTVGWTGQAGSAAICSYALEQSINGGTWTPVSLTSPTATTATATIPKSQDTARFQVEATDCSNVVSGWVQSAEFGYQFYEEQTRNHKFTYTAGWNHTACANCAGGFDETTTTPNATATLTLNSAYNVGLIFTVGPSLGMAEIEQTGVSTKYINTYASTTGYRMLLFKTGWSSFQYAVIQVVNVGPGIDIDGAVVIYAPLAKLGA